MSFPLTDSAGWRNETEIARWSYCTDNYTTIILSIDDEANLHTHSSHNREIQSIGAYVAYFSPMPGIMCEAPCLLRKLSKHEAVNKTDMKNAFSCESTIYPFGINHTLRRNLWTRPSPALWPSVDMRSTYTPTNTVQHGAVQWRRHRPLHTVFFFLIPTTLLVA